MKTDFVDRSGGPDVCWPWTGGRDRHGYGRYTVAGRSRLAHRLVYAAAYGPIPRGLVVRHRCDNPPCCNPAHLELGTQRENLQDMVARGRSTKGRPGRGGELCGKSKLTANQVAELRGFAAVGGWTQDQLGAAYGINRSQVGKIVARKVWR